MAVTTIHIVNAIPWSNLNRDQSGTPKNTMLGGVRRAMLSSQSLKRAARTIFEQEILQRSYRSRNLADAVAARAHELNPLIDIETATKEAQATLNTLPSSKKPDPDSNETAGLVFISNEEMEELARLIAAGETPAQGAGLLERKTGALSIASFGRMAANLSGLSVEAAVAVSPAITTHAALIESDYFSAVDDLPTDDQGAGAGHIGSASYTSGVFYRTVTIDHGQLKESWTGADLEGANEQVAEMVKSLVRGLPTGKKNSTAPYLTPILVLAEEQKHRIAYDFETPVPRAQDGGYAHTTVERLEGEMEMARAFDPDSFGRTFAAGSLEKGLHIADSFGTLGELANWVAARVLA